ncbi:MAG: hypothetical protein AAFX85_04930 [Pseudomonadota bacterium]
MRRLGGMWLRIYELLCLQRVPLESVVELVASRYAVPAGEARRAAREVKGRIPDCGAYVGEYPADDSSEGERAPDATPLGVEEALMAEAMQTLVAVVASTLQDENATPEADVFPKARLAGAARALDDELQLAPSDRLLLKLVYRDNVSLPRAAKLLGLHPQKARRQHKALLQRIRAVLSRWGLDAQSLESL